MHSAFRQRPGGLDGRPHHPDELRRGRPGPSPDQVLGPGRTADAQHQPNPATCQLDPLDHLDGHPVLHEPVPDQHHTVRPAGGDTPAAAQYQLLIIPYKRSLAPRIGRPTPALRNPRPRQPLKIITAAFAELRSVPPGSPPDRAANDEVGPHPVDDAGGLGDVDPGRALGEHDRASGRPEPPRDT